MSSTIDERIVDMQFNNGEFEKGIQQSLKSLEALKKGLELDKSAKSLENLEKLVSHFSFDNLASQIDNISDRFTTLGIMGVRALERITDKAIDAGMHLAKSLSIDQVTAGMSKYEMKTKAVQTIMGANPDKTIDEVEAVLSRLNKYTDETSYDFAEMTNTIGKFTANGVDLDVAERAMEGIGNAAAKSGAGIQEANRAMYNFAQALAVGKVTLMDWKSIENANMATKEFKEVIIETAVEMGTLKRGADGVTRTLKGTEVTYQNFNSTLAEGWFTSDVMLSSLEKYADTTTEFGLEAFHAAQQALTFTDAINAVKDAVSTNWMKTFQLLFGNLEEAIELWTGLANGLIEVTDAIGSARNELLEGWRDLNGEDGRAILLEGLVEIWHVLQDIATVVGDIFREFFPPITAEHLMAISKAVKAFADRLKGALSLIYETRDILADVTDPRGGWQITMDASGVTEARHEVEALDRTLKRGSRGDDVRELQQHLIDMGYNLDKYGADGIYGPETEAALKAYQHDMGLVEDGVYGIKTHEAMQGSILGQVVPTDGETDALDEAEDRILGMTAGMEKLQRIARGVFAVLRLGWDGLKFGLNVVKSVIGIFKPFGEVIVTVAAVLGDCLYAFQQWVSETEVFDKWLAAFQKGLEPFAKVIQNIADSILAFFETGEQITSFTVLWDKLKRVIQDTNFGKQLSELIEKITGSKLFRAVGTFVKTHLTNLLEKIKSIIEVAKIVLTGTSLNAETMEKYGKAVFKARGILAKFQEVLGRIWGFFKGLGAKIVESAKAVAEFAKNLWEDLNVSERFVSAWEKIVIFFQQAIPAVKTFFSNLIGSIKDFVGQNWEKGIAFVKDLVMAIRDFFTMKTTEGLGWIDSLKERFKAFDKVGEWFKKLFEKISEAWSKNAENVEAAGNGLSDLFGQIRDWFAQIDGFDVAALLGIVTMISLVIGTVLALVKVVRLLNRFSKIKIGDWLDIEKDKKERGKTGDNLLKIAAAIGIVAAAAYLLGKMDQNQLKQGLLSVAGIIVALAALSIVTSKLAGNFKGGGVLKLAAGVGILAASIAALGFMNWDQILKGVGALGLILLELAAFMWLTKSGKLPGKNSFVGLGVGVLLLTLSLKILGDMEWSKIWNGVKALGLILLELAVFTRIAGGNKVQVSFLGLGVAIILIAKAVDMLGSMDTGKAIKGIIGVKTLISSLNKVTKMSAKKQSTKGVWQLVFLALALLPIVHVVKQLGNMDVGSAIEGIVAIKLLIGTLGSFLKKSGGGSIQGGISSLLSMLGVAGLLVLLVEAFKVVAKYPMREFLEFTAGLSAALIAVGYLIKSASSVSIGQALQGIANIAIFIGGFALLGVLTDWLDEITNGGFSEKVKSFALMFGEAMGTLIQGFLEPFTTGGESGESGDSKSIGEHVTEFIDDLKQVGPKLEELFDAFQPFLDKIKGVTEEHKNGALNFVAVAAALTAEGVFEALTQYVTKDNKGGMAHFVQALTETIPYLAQLVTAAKLLGPAVESELRDKIIPVFTAVGDLAGTSAIQTLTGLLSTLTEWITGGPTMVSFVKAIIGTVPWIVLLGHMASLIGASTQSNLEKLSGPFTTIGNFAGDVAAVLGVELLNRVVKLFGGSDNNVQTFIEHMTSAIDPLKTLASKASDVSEDDVAKVSLVGQMIGALGTAAKKLPRQGGLLGGILGNIDVVDFKNGLINLGSAFKTFSQDISKVKDFDETKIKAAISIMEGVSQLESSLETYGRVIDWLTGKKDLGEFGRRVAELGAQFASFSTDISTIDLGAIDELLPRLESLVNIANGSLRIQDAQAAYSQLESFIGYLSQGIETFMPSLETIGEKMMGYIQTGLLTRHGKIALSDEFMASFIVGSLIDALTPLLPQFATIGANIDAGIANGIRKHQSVITTAGKFAAMQAYLSVCQFLGIRSPSRKFAEVGMYSDQGWAEGLTGYSYLVERASSNVAQEALNTVETMMADISTILDGEPDLNPVIRPVIDLTDVSAGADTIGSIFSDSRLGIGSTTIARNISGGTLNAAFSNSDVVSAIGTLNDRMNSMAESISNLKLVLDTGVVAGHLSGPIDLSLGEKAFLAERRS